MDVEVLLFGQLYELAGTRQEVVSLKEAAQLTDLLQQMGKKHGTTFGEKMGDLRGIRILINGREYSLLDGLQTQLKDKDTIAFLPPIDGG